MHAPSISASSLTNIRSAVSASHRLNLISAAPRGSPLTTHLPFLQTDVNLSISCIDRSHLRNEDYGCWLYSEGCFGSCGCGVVILAARLNEPSVVPNAFHVVLYNVMVSELALMNSLWIHHLVCDTTE